MKERPVPKIKTRRGAAKRFKTTGSGKLRRNRAYHRHQLSAKTRKQKRRLRLSTEVAGADARAVRRLLPNG